MKLFKKLKDGGLWSKVTGYFLIEAKRLFSIVLLRFDHGSREAYHSHAFNAVSWVLKGELTEYLLDGTINFYPASFWPVITKRDTFHQVHSDGTTWVLSFRGPWAKTWQEYLPIEQKTHGRKEVC